MKSQLPEGQRTSKRIRRYWQKIARINNWIAHNISKEIVNKAKENDAMIGIENLKYFKPKQGKISKKMNRKLANWVHGRIRKYTTYKANWEGIFVKYVNPKDTSSRCHLCGSVGYRNRASFKCLECEKEWNADFNASANIGIRAKFPDVWGSVNLPLASSYKSHLLVGE